MSPSVKSISNQRRDSRRCLSIAQQTRGEPGNGPWGLPGELGTRVTLAIPYRRARIARLRPAPNQDILARRPLGTRLTHAPARCRSTLTGAVVRRLVGYDRLEWPALPALERIHDLAGDYINFLHPVRKLVSKTRTGPRVTRRYDVAQTPFHRLINSGVLSIAMTRQLQKRSHNIDPYRLKVQLEHAQRTLTARAVRSDSYVRQP